MDSCISFYSGLCSDSALRQAMGMALLREPVQDFKDDYKAHF